MNILYRNLVLSAVCTLLFFSVGCGGKPLSQISGTVTFKGEPIPAGDVSFTPDVSIPSGELKMFMVTDGKYDSSKDPNPGLLPGKYKVRIAGYDGKRIPMFYKGKQIFNAIEQEIIITEGKMTKDFDVPASAGQNVKIFETADF